METAEHRIDGSVAYRALVRYDAYGEMSGRQSTSIALLDANRSGVVLSSIHHRDQARLYAKQVREGKPELELSPEEDEAVKRALGADGSSARASGVRVTPLVVVPERMRVAYFGPEGTFTQEALLAATAGRELDAVPLPTIYDTVMAVHDGTVERALVPIENSLEGSVNATLDALAMETEDVAILGEVVHPIRHCLIARTALELSEIEAVVSHPQATAQCARFIRARLPGARVLAGSSTAEAVRTVAEHDGPWAALGNRVAAERYGCQVLRAGVEDVADNETRFVWLGPVGRHRRVGRGSGRARRLRARAGGSGQRGPRGATARSVEDRDRVLGRRLRGAGLARPLPVRVRHARRQPDPDRVAAAQAGPRALHVLRRPRGSRHRAACRRRSRRAPRPRRGPARARFVPGGDRLTGVTNPYQVYRRHRYTPASHGHFSTSASVVRAASRAPAART